MLFLTLAALAAAFCGSVAMGLLVSLDEEGA